MAAKLTKEELFKKAYERFNSWVRMYNSPEVTAEQMYEDMSCSCYSGHLTDDLEINTPVIDMDLRFSYRGYDFELSSCNIISSREQILGLTNNNIKHRFPHGVFTDRYVCWMYGHKDIIGHTKEESDELEDWTPEVYLVPGTWAWGAEYGLLPGSRVTQCIIEGIDKFLETFKE